MATWQDSLGICEFRGQDHVSFIFLFEKKLTNNHTPTALSGKKRKRKKLVNETASFQELKGGCKKLKDKATCSKTVKSVELFSHDVMAAILVFQNDETAAILVYQTNPVQELNPFLK